MESLNSNYDRLDKQDEKEYTPQFSTTMNLLNSLIGAGILGVSNSFTFCGFLPSIILLTVIAIISYFATVMVVKLKEKTGLPSFNEIVKVTLGSSWGHVFAVLNLLFCFSAMVVFLIIGFQTIQSLLEIMGHPIRGTVEYRLIFAAYCVLIPFMLTLPRDLSILGKFSSFSVLCLFGFVGIIIYEGIKILPKQGISRTADIGKMNSGFFNALAIYSLTFALAVVVIPIVSTAHPSFKKRCQSIGTAFLCCYVCVMVPGVIGYLIFGADTNEVLLESFSRKDPVILAVRICFFFVVNGSYPIVGLTIASTISRYLFGVDDSTSLPARRRIAVLVTLNLPIILVAILVPSVRPILAIGGALGGCLLNFAFPAIIWIVTSNKPITTPMNMLMVVFACFGVVTSLVSTYESVLDLIHSLHK